MRKITNILSPLLEMYRYKDKKDPFKIFEQMKKENSLKRDKKKGNVLVLPLRVSPTSNTFEGVLSYALKYKGYDVYSLMCGQMLTKCDHVNQKQPFSLACSLCLKEQEKFTSAYETISYTYDNMIESSEYNKILTIVKETKLEDIFSYKYKDVSIGKYVEGGVARFLLMSNIDLKKNEKLIREYFFTALTTAEATINILKKVKPKFVVMSHGIYSTWGTALEVCKTLGFHSIVWGRGYVGKGNIVASHNNSYLFDTIYEPTDLWENNIISEENKAKITDYFSKKRNPESNVDYVNYYKNVGENKEDIFALLNIKKERKRIGVYPNIPWDGKMFSATKEFPDLNTFVKVLLEWAEKNQKVDIIIRAHPAEAYQKGNETMETFFDILSQECSELPQNIIYIEPTSSINSYQVSEICDVALMYASTLALEFAYMKHPVIQVGLNNVSNKGLVFDAPTKKIMYDFLDKALNGSLKVDEDMHKKIVKYSDYWLNKRHIPEELLYLKKLTFDGYTFKDIDSLVNSEFKVLEWFIKCCETKALFIWNSN